LKKTTQEIFYKDGKIQRSASTTVTSLSTASFMSPHLARLPCEMLFLLLMYLPLTSSAWSMRSCSGREYRHSTASSPSLQCLPFSE